MPTTIRSPYRGATFIQLWRMPSMEQQQNWLQTMHKHIHLLQRQPGFQSMSLHASLDGRNVVVYAQWASGDVLKAAVDDPEVKAARVQLDRHGEPDGTLYRVEAVHLPQAMAGGVMDIQPGAEMLTFVNVWVTQTVERQQSLLAAMTGETAAIVSKPGSRGMSYHPSLDGTRLVVYAQWESLEAFDAAISDNAEALENRRKLAQYGEPLANTYRVDSVYFSKGVGGSEETP